MIRKLLLACKYTELLRWNNFYRNIIILSANEAKNPNY